MVYPILVGEKLLIELASVEALYHRAGFTSAAKTVLSGDSTSTTTSNTTLPLSARVTLTTALRGNNVKQEEGNGAFAVITILNLTDLKNGAVVSDESAFIAALISTTQSIFDVLSVPSAARENALIIPSSPRAARDAFTSLNSFLCCENEKTMLLRTSCTAAASLAGKNATISHHHHTFRSTSLPPPPIASTSVTLSELELFLFPPGEEHSRSVGRLIAFALYGPLREGKLWAGRGGSRALTRLELCAEIDAIERHDALRGESTLGDVESVLRVARADGRYELPRMSLPQMRAFLRDIPRDTDTGAADFHDIQRLVLSARARRVRDLGLLFPHEPSLEEARVSFMPRAPLLGRASLSANAAEAQKAVTAQFHSSDVWKKTSDVSHRRHHAGLLNSKSQSIAALAEANSATMIPALLSNILLLRHDEVGGGGTAHRSEWKNDAPFGLGKGRGTYVPGSVARGVGGLHTKLR